MPQNLRQMLTTAKSSQKQSVKELTRYFSGYEVKFGKVELPAKYKNHDGTAGVPMTVQKLYRHGF